MGLPQPPPRQRTASFAAQVGNVHGQHRQPDRDQPKAEDGEEPKKTKAEQHDAAAHPHRAGLRDEYPPVADFPVSHIKHMQCGCLAGHMLGHAEVGVVEAFLAVAKLAGDGNHAANFQLMQRFLAQTLQDMAHFLA